MGGVSSAARVPSPQGEDALGRKRLSVAACDKGFSGRISEAHEALLAIVQPVLFSTVVLPRP